MPQHQDWESYCGGGEESDWISTRNWTQLLNRMRVGGSSPPHGVMARALARARGPGVLVTAEVPAKGPARILGDRPATTLSPPAPDSEFRLVVRNGAGGVVSDTRVEVEATTHGKEGGVLVATVPGAGAAKVELLPR